MRVGVAGIAFCSDAADGFYADCDEDFLCALARNTEDFCEAGNADDERLPIFVYCFLFHFVCVVLVKVEIRFATSIPRKSFISGIRLPVSHSMAFTSSSLTMLHNVEHTALCCKAFFSKKFKKVQSTIIYAGLGRMYLTVGCGWA